jgi:hypothetical protein
VTWVNLDDQMPEHPKIISLSDGAFRLHVSAIAYCNRFLTDGIIHAETVARLVPRFRRSYLDELLRRMLWVEIVAAATYEIHDYLDWNKSRAEIEEQRGYISKVRSEAGKRGARARWGPPND